MPAPANFILPSTTSRNCPRILGFVKCNTPLKGRVERTMCKSQGISGRYSYVRIHLREFFVMYEAAVDRVHILRDCGATRPRGNPQPAVRATMPISARVLPSGSRNTRSLRS
jgi:hypothetical protein